MNLAKQIPDLNNMIIDIDNIKNNPIIKLILNDKSWLHGLKNINRAYVN